jgi:hypothetical protein
VKRWVGAIFGLLVGVATFDARAGDASDAETDGAITDAGDAAIDGDAGDDVGVGSTVVATACTTPQDHCERAPFTVARGETIGADFDFDTGWLPSGSDIQVRLVAFLHGRTNVQMSGWDDVTWPDALTVTVNGEKASGSIAIDDGFEVRAQARFHVTVGGVDYDWSGDIPGIPKIVLATKTSVTFDPWAWKESGKPASVSGTTGKIIIVKVPLTDSFIPIPGIEGGFDLDGEAEFDASYVSTRIAFDEVLHKGAMTDVTFASNVTHALLAESIPAFETSMTVHGELTHGIKLHFLPGFYFTILGSTFDLSLADIPVPLPTTTEDWRFPDVHMHFPLPRIEVVPQTIDLGTVKLGDTKQLNVTAFDTGEAKLVVDAKDPKSVLAVTTKHVEIQPGYSDSVLASFTASQLGPFEADIVLDTNDPHTPTTIHVKGVVADEASAPEGSTDQNGSCGCRVAGRSTTSDRAWLLLFAAALTALGRIAARASRSTSSRPKE